MKTHLARATCLAAFVTAFSGCLYSPIFWSPDGRWLAYTSAVRPAGSRLPAGWIFESDARRPASVEKPTGYRLWATRTDGSTPVLIEESTAPISSPGWSPDGSAIAYVKVVPEAGGRGRYELVVREGLDRRRELFSQPLPLDNEHLAELPGLAVSWSPDGRYLAVPTLEPRGLAIVRAENGRVVKVLEDAYLPSWSPVGGRLAYVRGGEPQALYCLDASLGAPRHLADVGASMQPAAWSRDGLSVFAVARRPKARGARIPSEQADLIRVRVDETPPVPLPIRILVPETLTRGKSLQGVSMALDRDGDNAFFATAIEGRDTTIVWCLPRANQVYRQFHPVDIALPIGSLAVSPSGKGLAMRLGPIESQSPPLVFDLETNKSTLIAADDDARLDWIATLASAARGIVANPSVPPTDEGRPIARPTWLPVVGEFPLTSEAGLRLKKIGRLGRAMCDRPADAPPAEPSTLRALAEARLFFDYLKGDYLAAEASLSAIEPGLETPRQRQRALGLRAQLFAARGEFDRARATLNYLKATEPAAPQRIEMVGDHPVVIIEAAVGQGWPAYLLSMVDAQERQVAANPAGGPSDPLDFGNPDAPMPGLGLDPVDDAPAPRPGDPQAIPQLEPMPLIEPDVPQIREIPPALPRIRPD
ncbi:hypothetical protein EP7_001263 [Isosphaeraceae bacterium EP7]